MSIQQILRGVIVKQVPNTVSMEYRALGDQHTFRSTDYFGVYVSDSTLRGAFDKIVSALESIVQINTGSEVGFEADKTFEEFQASLEADKDTIPHPSIIIAGSSSEITAN